MDWYAVVFAVVVLGSVLSGLNRAFVKSFIELLGAILALIVAFQNYEILVPVGRLLLYAEGGAAEAIAFTVAWVALSVVAAVIAAIVGRIVAGGNDYGAVDRGLGVIVGAVKGILAISVLFWIIFAIPVTPLVASAQESRTAVWVVQLIPDLLGFLGVTVPSVYMDGLLNVPSAEFALPMLFGRILC